MQQYRNSPLIWRIAVCLALMLPFSACDTKDKPAITEPNTEGRILAVLPSAVEQGSRPTLSLVGENTEFGDSVWLEKSGIRIYGVKTGPGTDTSLTAVFDIPNGAATGSWDLVVAGKGNRGEARLAKGVSIVPGLVFLIGTEPYPISTYGRNDVRVRFGGTEFLTLAPTVKLIRGEDTLAFPDPVAFNDTALGFSFDLADSTAFGSWDLEVKTGEHRLYAAKAIRVDRPNPWIATIAQDSLIIGKDQILYISASGTSFLKGERSVWLKKGDDSIPAWDMGPYGNPAEGLLHAAFRIPKDAPAGKWDLYVRQPWYVISKAECVTLYNAPPSGSIVRVAPDTLRSGGTNVIHITTRGIPLWSYRFGFPHGAFRFSGTGRDSLPVSEASYVNDSTVELRVDLRSGASRGYRDLEVGLNDEIVGLHNALFIDPIHARIVSIAPAQAERDQDIALVLSAVGTRFQQDTRTVRLFKGGDTLDVFPGNSIQNGHGTLYSSDSDLTAYFRIPADAPLGMWSVQLSQPWFTDVKADAIEVKESTQPRVKSVSPVTAQRGGPLEFTITGHRTEFQQGTLSHVRVELVRDGAGVFGLSSGRRSTWRDSAVTQTLPIPMEVPAGTYDVRVSYFVPKGEADGEPLGDWVFLPTLAGAFLLKE